MIPLIGLASAMIQTGARQVAERDASRGRKLALLNAESGIDHALAQLLSTPNDFDTVEVSYDNSDSLRYRVSLENLGEDGLDNDGDFEVDEADEGALRRLVSRGSLNVADYAADGTPIPVSPKFYTKQIRAFGKSFSGLPLFPWAVYLGDPNAEVQFNGNSFQIDGNDWDTDLTLSDGDAVVGIATTGDSEDIVDQLSSQQMDNVDGDGGEPSVGSVSSVDIQKVIDDYKASASIVFNGDTNYKGDLGDPSSGGYVTTYSHGNLDISGGSEGAGLLLVEGDLEITGSFEYTGVIIVTGQVIFRGGGGGKRVVGTLLVGGDVINDTQTSGWGNHGDEDLEISGTVDILYSSQAQGKVGDSVSSMTIFGWQEL